jgi:hypothetical protein
MRRLLSHPAGAEPGRAVLEAQWLENAAPAGAGVLW